MHRNSARQFVTDVEENAESTQIARKVSFPRRSMRLAETDGAYCVASNQFGHRAVVGNRQCIYSVRTFSVILRAGDHSRQRCRDGTSKRPRRYRRRRRRDLATKARRTQRINGECGVVCDVHTHTTDHHLAHIHKSEFTPHFVSGEQNAGQRCAAFAVNSVRIPLARRSERYALRLSGSARLCFHVRNISQTRPQK